MNQNQHKEISNILSKYKLSPKIDSQKSKSGQYKFRLIWKHEVFHIQRLHGDVFSQINSRESSSGWNPRFFFFFFFFFFFAPCLLRNIPCQYPSTPRPSSLTPLLWTSLKLTEFESDSDSQATVTRSDHNCPWCKYHELVASTSLTTSLCHVSLSDDVRNIELCEYYPILKSKCISKKINSHFLQFCFILCIKLRVSFSENNKMKQSTGTFFPSYRITHSSWQLELLSFTPGSELEWLEFQGNSKVSP